jgi:kumamolisin
MASKRTIIRGSEPKSAAKLTAAPVDPNELVTVTLVLRRNPAAKNRPEARDATGRRKHLTRQEFAAIRGADPDDVSKIENFATEHDLTIVDVDTAARTVVLRGTAAAANAAFGVNLQRVSGAGAFRGHAEPVSVPADLGPVVEAVLGLSNCPVARPRFQIFGAGGAAASRAAQPNATQSFTPPDLARLYDFPAALDGTGQRIAIIELNVNDPAHPLDHGGFHRADLKTYFANLGIPLPKITSVSVLGEHNRPNGNPNSVDGEVLLDIEVAGAIAPKAHIAVYFAPNTDAGFLGAINKAIQTAGTTLISISWGAPEADWDSQTMQAFDRAFQDAADVGVSIFCAAGDRGSSDGVGDGRAHADFPASSPNVVACGGTRLTIKDQAISTEVVWNDGATTSATGGGISDEFSLPPYQTSAGVPHSVNPGGRVGRGVPDVAADASPASGYRIRVDGKDLVFGGTSAVAPLYAGLFALVNQAAGAPAGFVNPVLYRAAAKTAFNDITSGNNDKYVAKSGWDACTGLGSPRGGALLQVLGSHAVVTT